MKWKHGEYNTHHLRLAGGFISAGISWSCTGERGYNVSINGNKFTAAFKDLPSAKRAAEEYIHNCRRCGALSGREDGPSPSKSKTRAPVSFARMASVNGRSSASGSPPPSSGCDVPGNALSP